MTESNRFSNYTPALAAVTRNPAPARKPVLSDNVTPELTSEDRAALASIGNSGLFTLEKSRGMYAGVKSLRNAA